MSKTLKDSATCSDTICMDLSNDATQQASFYIGQAAVLDIRLVNATGADLPLQDVKLDIFFLSLDVNLANCKIDLPGWTHSAGAYSLTLAYDGPAANWGQGAFNALAFQITGVQSSLTQATSGFFQITFSGLTGQNVPGRLKTPLDLIAAPQPGNADLDISLHLDGGGIVYVSQPNGSLISNRLFLNVVNDDKVNPLFRGKAGQQGNPQITVSFVYGSTPGALAPDSDKSNPQLGSAWNIKGKISVSEGNDWGATNPDSSGSAEDPVWLLTPGQTNVHLIGTGDAAAVQFEFDEVISQTQPGVTSMYVLFSGFKQDDNTKYNDKQFVLAISKQFLPAPGLLRFSTPSTKISVGSSSQQISIPLSWSMTGVSKIVLQSSSPDIPNLNIPDITVPYPSPQPLLQYDGTAIQFSGVVHSGSLVVTCTAYDANGNTINDLQQVITIDFPPVVTVYTGDIQADGSLLLKWQTEGATGVTIACLPSPEPWGPNNLTNQVTLQSPQWPLLHNEYYALTADGPNATSAPCVFGMCRKFELPPSQIDIGNTMTVVFTPNGDYAFVVDLAGVLVIPIGSGLPFPAPSQTIPTGYLPMAAAFTPDGNYAFVVNTFGGVSVIPTEGGPPFSALPQTIPVGPSPKAIAISPNGDYAFVPNYGDGTVSVIPIGGGPPFSALPQTIPVGNGPTAVAFTPKGDYAFVVNFIDSTVSVIVIGSGPPFSVLPQTIPVGDNPSAIAISPNGDYAYVTNVAVNGDYTVSLIPIEGGPPFSAPPQSIAVTGPPLGIGVSPNGDYVFVCNSWLGGQMSVLVPISVSAF